MLEEIKKRVQAKIDASHKEVVLGVYQNMIQSHNEFCGCNYCEILSKYVNAKKYLTRMKRMFNRTDKLEYDDILVQKLRIFNLKCQKDKLKLLDQKNGEDNAQTYYESTELYRSQSFPTSVSCV